MVTSYKNTTEIPLQEIPSKLNLLGLNIDNFSMSEALEQLDYRISHKIKSRVFYVNSDCLNKTFSNPQYMNLLKGAEQLYPDGSGIKIAAQMTEQNLRENINGTDMFPEICELSQNRGYKIFFLGGKPGVANKMVTNLSKDYPELQVVGCHHGYLKSETNQQIIQKINDSGADILFVAMGAPQQEAWITYNFESLNVSLMLGVGGLFDFYSGNIPRAPIVLRKLGLEWTWRLYQEPTRMWRRYILGNPLFLFRIWRYGKKTSI